MVVSTSWIHGTITIIVIAAIARLTPVFHFSSRSSRSWAWSCFDCSSKALTSACGSSASYPVDLMASTSASGSTVLSSNVTVALFSIRLTVASLTPLVALSADWTRLWHAAQCIPVTGIVIFLDMGRRLHTPHPYVNSPRLRALIHRGGRRGRRGLRAHLRPRRPLRWIGRFCRRYRQPD